MEIEVVVRPARPGEKERLLKNTANSRRVQRRLRNVFFAGIPVILGLLIAGIDGTIILTGAATLVIVIGVGYWITSGHIREWNDRLREIDRAASKQLKSP